MKRKEAFSVRAGIVEYGRSLFLQERIFEAKREGKLKQEVLILLQHPPTITIGKKGSFKEILIDLKEIEKKGIKIYWIGRGGRVSYHGPGQIVGYPIIDLSLYGKDLHLYLRLLEEVIMKTCQDFGIRAQRKEGLTGVWVEDKKIASIGIQVKNWISMHGFAFNVNCPLEYFRLIQPCGMSAGVMSSLNLLLGKNLDIKKVEEKLILNFASVFKFEIKNLTLEE
ncbi:lipoyl(octanoyl) transferase LipB, partial [Candidatus Aerophobetes bacterium]|nr:lipoyl(octanoyl) transferase LipB [Candidatus Aerophobetes bacterium]